MTCLQACSQQSSNVCGRKAYPSTQLTLAIASGLARPAAGSAPAAAAASSNLKNSLSPVISADANTCMHDKAAVIDPHHCTHKHLQHASSRGVKPLHIEGISSKDGLTDRRINALPSSKQFKARSSNRRTCQGYTTTTKTAYSRAPTCVPASYSTSTSVTKRRASSRCAAVGMKVGMPSMYTRLYACDSAR